MKSIIFVLLTTCCLFPFSSATFTSENPIILPTTTHDNNIVLDNNNLSLITHEEYIIENPLPGGGEVYLGNITGDPICPTAVLQHIPYPGQFGNGTRVQFRLNPDDVPGAEVKEMFSLNIMFSSNQTSELCANETVWKVGDRAFVVTGGALGSAKDVFKIKEYGKEIPGHENVYKLMHCPVELPCVDVSWIFANGHPRLTVLSYPALPFIFKKAGKGENV